MRKTDRRNSPRFELTVPVWADIELPETARVLNTSDTGLLIESPIRPALHAHHGITPRTKTMPRTVATIVRHVRPAEPEGTFLVGLEIVGARSVGDSGVNGADRRGHGAHGTALRVDVQRGPRRACETLVLVDLNLPRPVRIVDISATGILLASRQGSAVGACGLLRFAVGTNRFAVAVEIRRQTQYLDSSGFLLGARLLGPVEDQRRIIDTLVAGGTRPTAPD